MAMHVIIIVDFYVKFSWKMAQNFIIKQISLNIS